VPQFSYLHRDANGRKRTSRPQQKARNHPIYSLRESKEHPLLEHLLANNPPVGGLAAYIADLDREPEGV
jgi:hypothetical protein